MALEYVKPDFERFLSNRKLEGWPLEGVCLVAFPYTGHQPSLLVLPGLPDRDDQHQVDLGGIDRDAATSDESGITFDSSEDLKTTVVGRINDLDMPLGTIGLEERWWFVPDFMIEELPFDKYYKTLLRDNAFMCGPGAAGVDGTDLGLLHELHPEAPGYFESTHGGIPFPMVLEMIKILTHREAYRSAKAARLNLGDSFDVPKPLFGTPRAPSPTQKEEPKTGKIFGLVKRISPGLGRKLSSRKLRP